MRPGVPFATGLLLCLCGHEAFAAGADGNAAVSLAARVGERSPLLTVAEKAVLAAYLDGGHDVPWTKA